jgi:hypothetical protein
MLFLLIAALVLCLRCCLQELFAVYDKDKSGTTSFASTLMLFLHMRALLYVGVVSALLPADVA